MMTVQERGMKRLPAEEGSASHPDDETLGQWWDEFEAAAGRSLETRLRYSFIRTYKPVLDDAPYRAFDTMDEYRRWCERSLPDWLGYGRV